MAWIRTGRVLVIVQPQNHSATTFLRKKMIFLNFILNLPIHYLIDKGVNELHLTFHTFSIFLSNLIILSFCRRNMLHQHLQLCDIFATLFQLKQLSLCIWKLKVIFYTALDIDWRILGRRCKYRWDNKMARKLNRL